MNTDLDAAEDTVAVVGERYDIDPRTVEFYLGSAAVAAIRQADDEQHSIAIQLALFSDMNTTSTTSHES